ncbi:11169_t:CDS:2, partial [Dentiscutata heterogama]
YIVKYASTIYKCAFLKQYQIEFFPNNSFEEFKIYNSTFPSDSYKALSVKYNKLLFLNKITFSQKYTLENFTNDLKRYQKVELHENILKFIAIFKQSINEVIFVHEYALDGTLRQYLKQNISKINWNDKLHLAKQLSSAIKYFHENNIVHTNLNSEKIYVHKGDIK